MYQLILGFITSFVVTLLSIPASIRFAERYQLFDRPDVRKTHQTSVPALGGIAVVASVVLSIIIWTPLADFGDIQYILGALMILFLVGAKDDLDPVSPWIKLAAQVLSALILVHLAGIRITSLYGILGIYDLPYTISVILSVFTILVITNSFNLIDGIDGLLGGISLVILSSFGIWFYLTEELDLAIMAASLIGAILGFLKFNLTPARIFMGDTGSLFIGVVSSIFAIQFIEMNKISLETAYHIEGVPTVAVGILLLPLMDTLRVFVLRVIKGKSPLQPDQSHMHHILVRRGYSHLQVSFFLTGLSLVLSGFFFYFHDLGAQVLLFILLGFAISFSVILHFLSLQQDANRSV